MSPFLSLSTFLPASCVCNAAPMKEDAKSHRRILSLVYVIHREYSNGDFFALRLHSIRRYADLSGNSLVQSKFPFFRTIDIIERRISPKLTRSRFHRYRILFNHIWGAETRDVLEVGPLRSIDCVATGLNYTVSPIWDLFRSYNALWSVGRNTSRRPRCARKNWSVDPMGKLSSSGRYSPQAMRFIKMGIFIRTISAGAKWIAAISWLRILARPSHSICAVAR